MLVLWSFSSCICGRFGCVFPCHNLSLRIMSYSIFAVIFAAHLLSRSQQRESLIANAMYSCVSIAYLLNYIDESIRNPMWIEIKQLNSINSFFLSECLEDLSLNRPIFDFFRTALAYERLQQITPIIIHSLGEQTSGTVVYQLSLPTPVTIPEHTLKSIPFLVTRVMVESFFYYSSYFSAMNSQGKLLTAYNLTPMKNFLPTIVVYSRVNKADFSDKSMYRILWPIQHIR